MHMLGMLTLLLALGGLSMSFADQPSGRGEPAPGNQEWNNATRPAGFISKTIDVDGIGYKYVVYAPSEYHPQSRQKAWPTIMSLHGSGECGTDGLKQIAVGLGPSIMHDRDRWPFLVIFPQKPDRSKQWEDYDKVVMAMLDAEKKQYPIDPERTYLTGLSQGGHGTWTIGANHPDVWAAIAPVCAYVKRNGTTSEVGDLVPKLSSLPVWAFHGAKDDVVLPAETTTMIDALKAAKPAFEPKMTIYPDANHNSWDKAYAEPELPSWFLSHAKAVR